MKSTLRPGEGRDLQREFKLPLKNKSKKPERERPAPERLRVQVFPLSNITKLDF